MHKQPHNKLFSPKCQKCQETLLMHVKGRSKKPIFNMTAAETRRMTVGLEESRQFPERFGKKGQKHPSGTEVK